MELATAQHYTLKNGLFNLGGHLRCWVRECWWESAAARPWRFRRPTTINAAAPSDRTEQGQPRAERWCRQINRYKRDRDTRHCGRRSSVRPSVRPLARSPATELVSPIIIMVPNLLSTTLDLREAAQHTRILSLTRWLAGSLALSLDSTLLAARQELWHCSLSLACLLAATAHLCAAAFWLGKVNCGASRAFGAVRLRLSVWLFSRAPRFATARRRTRSFECIWAFSTPFRTHFAYSSRRAQWLCLARRSL